MKQEHRFVADLYRYIAPFIDTAEPIFLSLDGEAAKKGVSEKHFGDAGIPDMWFTLVGATMPTLIEAKIVEGKKVTLSQSQLCAWRGRGPGAHKPCAWVAANDSFEKYFCWRHDDFVSLLDTCTSERKYPQIRIPSNAQEFADIRLVALALLRTC